MFKVKMNLDLTAAELKEGLTPNLDAVMGVTSRQAATEARRLAETKLQSGLHHWVNGFTVNKVSDGVWLMAVEGKLGTMMEEGFNGEEFKKLILNGNRARHNRSQGKDYVDVPIPLTGGNLKTTTSNKLREVTVTQFKSGADVIRSVTTSDWKNKGIVTRDKIVQNVKGIIRTKEQASDNFQFLMIRRVTPETNWGSWKGAHVLEMKELEAYMSKQFDINLEKLL